MGLPLRELQLLPSCPDKGMRAVPTLEHGNQGMLEHGNQGKWGLESQGRGNLGTREYESWGARGDRSLRIGPARGCLLRGKGQPRNFQFIPST